jgi:hypothetical protein
VLIVSELSRIGRDTVRTPAAVLQLEEAGVEIRSYLSDALISLADESSEIHTIVNSLAARRHRGSEASDQRAALVRERDRTAVEIRHLVDAVKLGRASETLLSELQKQESALKAPERRIAEATGPRVVPADDARLVERVGAVATEFRATLKEGGSRARRLLQRLLNGRRVPCVPFREAGRRGYRFREEEIPYAAVLSYDIGGPNGT